MVEVSWSPQRSLGQSFQRGRIEHQNIGRKDNLYQPHQEEKDKKRKTIELLWATKNFDLFSEGCGFTDDSVMTIAVGEALMAVGPKADSESLTCGR